MADFSSQAENALEAVEHMLQVGLGNAGAFVLDGELNHAAGLTPAARCGRAAG
jgi:hypothetical protein